MRTDEDVYTLKFNSSQYFEPLQELQRGGGGALRGDQGPDAGELSGEFWQGGEGKDGQGGGDATEGQREGGGRGEAGRGQREEEGAQEQDEGKEVNERVQLAFKIVIFVGEIKLSFAARIALSYSVKIDLEIPSV